MLDNRHSSLLSHYVGISRLLAGQLDFHSAIRAVSEEVRHIVPHDHFDVCIMTVDGRYHTAYESGFETEWGLMPPRHIDESPIRPVLIGEIEYLLTGNACADARFHGAGIFSQPILDNRLKSRLHVPLKVQGDVIGALSCSCLGEDLYSLDDIEHARSIADLLAPYFFALRAAEQAKRAAIVEAEAAAREEGLRLGALKLTQALEAERQRIGMDLHDQTLADLTRMARRVEKLIHKPELHGEQIEPIFRSLQQCMQDLRQIIEDAKPSILQLFGFSQAVENHLDRSIRDSGLAIAWSLDDDEAGSLIDRQPATVAVTLFRIVQEAVNNAVRHARTSHIAVRLRGAEEGELRVEILDDGIGYEAKGRRPGSGIDNMRTRAQLISARFEIGRADTDGGTIVRIVLPPQPSQEHPA